MRVGGRLHGFGVADKAFVISSAERALFSIISIDR